MQHLWFYCLVYVCILLFNNANCEKNLSCYQCTKTVNEECSASALLPCTGVADRCVTHITKDEQNGFSIRRECGLGPCSFDDNMATKGLGLDGCDRSQDEYFCLFCCRSNGCNRDAATTLKPPQIPLLLLFAAILISKAIF